MPTALPTQARMKPVCVAQVSRRPRPEPPDAPGAPAPVSSPTSMARASSATMLSSLVVTASSLNFRAFHHSERRGTNKQVLARGTNLARAPPLFVQDFAIKRVPRAPFVQDFAIRRALNRQPALGGSLYRKILHKFKASRIQQKEQKEIRPAKKEVRGQSSA